MVTIVLTTTNTSVFHILQVLIRMSYAGINGGCETFRVRGEHAFAANKAKDTYALGAEGSGIVAAVGAGVTSLAVGQAVACNSAAAFAEYGVTQAVMCTPVDEASAEAVALSLSAVTAAAALEVTAGLKEGDVVLVTAAAGGTGHFAVQLAQLAGARVVAVAGSEVKKKRLQALGLERVINYKEEVRGRWAQARVEGISVAALLVALLLVVVSLRRMQPLAVHCVQCAPVKVLMNHKLLWLLLLRAPCPELDPLHFHSSHYCCPPATPAAAIGWCIIAETSCFGTIVQDLAAVLAAEYPQGLDIVYEGVGGAVRAAIMPQLAPGGRLLQVGYISGGWGCCAQRVAAAFENVAVIGSVTPGSCRLAASQVGVGAVQCMAVM